MYNVLWAKGADLSLENYYLDVREGRVLKLSSLDKLKLFELAAISESIRTINLLLSANPLAIVACHPQFLAFEKSLSVP